MDHKLWARKIYILLTTSYFCFQFFQNHSSIKYMLCSPVGIKISRNRIPSEKLEKYYKFANFEKLPKFENGGESVVNFVKNAPFSRRRFIQGIPGVGAKEIRSKISFKIETFRWTSKRHLIVKSCNICIEFRASTTAALSGRGRNLSSAIWTIRETEKLARE